MQPALFLALVALTASDPAERIAERCQAVLDGMLEADAFPGGSAALILPDGTELTFVAGYADKDAKTPMKPDDRLLSGSIGKTYVAASALKLVSEEKLDLDAKVSTYFEGERAEWFAQVPNAKEITVRQLLRHETGIPRYVYARAFWDDLLGDPDRSWKPGEQVEYVFDQPPLHAAGEGWAYSDTNYIVLGVLIEELTGKAFNDYARETLLEPLGLRDTVPSDSRSVPGVVQGYSSLFANLGVPDKSLDDDGRFALNPQFEWCGGGYANTPLDLARWARLLYSGKAFEGDYLDEMLDAVPADPRLLGQGVLYGLGVMIHPTSEGPLRGHDGVMTGYLSTMGYFPERELALAFQINADDRHPLGRPMVDVLVELARIAHEELTAGGPEDD